MRGWTFIAFTGRTGGAGEKYVYRTDKALPLLLQRHFHPYVARLPWFVAADVDTYVRCVIRYGGGRFETSGYATQLHDK